jgi:sporulation protein YlmC with PRC-barrel domain
MAEYDPAVRFAEEQAALAITQQPGGLNAPLAPLPATGTDMAAAPAQDMTAATAEKPAAAPADEQVAATEAAPADDEAAAPADEQIAATEAAPADEEEAATPPASGTVAFISPSADQVRASDLMGNDVLGPEGESIGRISDLVFQAEGGAHAALVDVGGFLGVGERTVAISFGELQLSRPEEGGDLQVAVAMTREQLEQLPAVAIAEAALPPLAGAPSDTMAATEEPLPLPAPAGAERPADQTAATETPAAEPEEPMVAAGETPAATDELTTGSISASQDIAASSLIGARVYGPDDSSLGSIDDVVFDQGGAIDGVIVNVGGFLGIGSKPVALDFESLQVRQDEFNVVTVVVDATKDQLDQAPAYEVSMQ